MKDNKITEIFKGENTPDQPDRPQQGDNSKHEGRGVDVVYLTSLRRLMLSDITGSKVAG